MEDNSNRHPAVKVLVLDEERLTKTQRRKWENFLSLYPNFFVLKDITLTTVELGKSLDCRPDHVLRLLRYINRGFGGKLSIEHMVCDSRNRLFKADHLDLRNNVKGGRQRGCSKEKGFRGKSLWLRIWIKY